MRITLQTLDSATPENVTVAAGATVGDVVEDFAISTKKVRIIVNGIEIDDLDTELEAGDAIVLQPQNYSSGRYAA